MDTGPGLPYSYGGAGNDAVIGGDAIVVGGGQGDSGHGLRESLRRSLSKLVARRSRSMSAAPSQPPLEEIGPEDVRQGPGPEVERATPGTGSSALAPRRTGSWYEPSPRGGLRRIISAASPLPPRRGTPASLADGISLQNLDVVREREREFFAFLDAELDKVETFYKLKEREAGERLQALREQLHEMRNQRTEELAEIRRKKKAELQEKSSGAKYGTTSDSGDGKPGSRVTVGVDHSWTDPLKNALFRPGPNSKALQKMPQTPRLAPGTASGLAQAADPGRRDYTRRPQGPEVPYRTAKRKLKLALQEFYRGLELLKAYALLNRTAFRKLNKKYDKAVNARPPYRYLNEKVNRAWFVNSDVLEAHINTVEGLYARYFERGNRKIAAGKLRSIASHKPRDESGSAFRNGVLIGTGAVFAFQGLAYAADIIRNENSDPVLRDQTVYLLYIYAGYFLMLYLFFLFCIDCHIWVVNKINYPFIFEFDPRHHLDWRRMSEFPSFFLLLLGLVMWLNFAPPLSGSPARDVLFVWYPVILISLTVAILFLPAPVLAHRARRWIVYSHWRLLLSGLYPVEFRDFFLGDMYCSLTYATSNIELFFCLYARGWHGDLAQCTASSSRLFGFLSSLPGIWRAFQCIRRYSDTRNVFPHLVNCGKYVATIMAAVSLSIYRISPSASNLGLFVTFSTVNGLYTAVWDLFMDFSLLQPQSTHPYLRDIISLKRRWIYYVMIVVDPLLRQAWVLNVVYATDARQGALAVFFAAFLEVTRRGAWTLLRVENEHSSNVAISKAFRDVPLPYRLADEPLLRPPTVDEAESKAQADAAAAAAAPRTTGSDVGVPRPPSLRRTTSSRQAGMLDAASAQLEAGPGGLRQRISTGRRSFSRIMAEAHKQDFEKRRLAVPAGGVGSAGSAAVSIVGDGASIADASQAVEDADEDEHTRQAVAALHSDDEFDESEDEEEAEEEAAADQGVVEAEENVNDGLRAD